MERPRVELDSVEVVHEQAVEAAWKGFKVQLPTSEQHPARTATKTAQKSKTYSMAVSSHPLSHCQSVVIAMLLTADRVKTARESRCYNISSLEAEISRFDVAYAFHQLGN